MPAGITIVGLGPGSPGQLTREAYDVLSAAGCIHLRTERHPTVAHLPEGLELHSFDGVYEEQPQFDEVYGEIVRQIIELALRPQGVCYAVPGDPMVAESTVQRILAKTRELNLPVRLVNGLSFVEPTLAALGVDMADGLQVIDAMAVGLAHHPPLNPDLPALLGQVYNRRMASDVKLTLMNLYPDDHPVTLVIAAGTGQARVREMPLYELDRCDEIDHLSSLYIPPLPESGGLNTFLEIIAHLRAPDGCPWDREQTHQSLRNTLLEETYEVLAALDAGDTQALCEEMGDLLLQIVLHTQIAIEANEFKMPDVAGHIIAKMRRRHPHVFAQLDVSGSDQVLQNWEKIKAEERKAKGEIDQTASTSLLSGVPAAMPALARAQALGGRAARFGFDWAGIEGVLDKVVEEAHELATASEEDRAAELGDLLLTLVNLARWLDVDAETALRTTSDRFQRRFQAMEAAADEMDKALTEMDDDELDALWESAKASEKTSLG
jgi:tetrapyrrole methylase family protein / MazG family protein